MRKIKYQLVICLLAIATNALAQNVEFRKQNFPDRKAELKQAVKAIKQGDKYCTKGENLYPQALEAYLKAHRFNPNNALLNYKIGKCYLNSSHKTKSILFFEKALFLNPDLAFDILYVLGQAYHLNLQFDDAIAKYKEFRGKLSPSELTKLGPEIDKRITQAETGKELVVNPVMVFIDNLGPQVNSAYPEYGPIVNADESVLFFTSRRENSTGGKTDLADYQYFEDIYVTTNVDSQWTSPKNPGSPINTKLHDAIVGLRADGQKLFVYKGENGGDIYECTLKGDRWTTPKRLNKNINTKAHEASATWSFDGKTIYFISDREGGYGKEDIYMSRLDEKGRWGSAVNLGPVINTPEDETGVFMHPDGKTLYFSSMGHKSMGGHDIFKTVYEDGKWSEPENLGYPINTPDDDVFFSITASGKYGYYSSVKPVGFGGQDIYKITFLGKQKQLINNTEDNLLASQTEPVREAVMEAQIEIKSNQLTVLKGLIQDEETLQPLSAVIEITDNNKNEVIASFESNSLTGKYLVPLPSGKNYGIAVKAEGYIFHSENFDITATTEYREIDKNILLKKIATGKSIVLNNIFFDFDKSTLRPESTMELDRLVQLMNENPSLKIEISGHTDNIGSASYNQKLSEERAKSVVVYLRNKNISPDRLAFVGYGMEVPIAGNNTEEGRQKNRRTEFKILSK